MSFKLPSFDAEACALLCLCLQNSGALSHYQSPFPWPSCVDTIQVTSPSLPSAARARLSLRSSHYMAVLLKPLVKFPTLGSGHHKCSCGCAIQQVGKLIQLKTNTFPSFCFFPLLFSPFSFFFPRFFATWVPFLSCFPRERVSTSQDAV